MRQAKKTHHQAASTTLSNGVKSRCRWVVDDHRWSRPTTSHTAHGARWRGLCISARASTRASTRASRVAEWIGEDIRPHRRAHLHGTHTPCLPLLPPVPVGCLGVPRPRRNAASARARQQAVVCTGIRGWHRVYVAPYAAEATAMQHKRTQHACTMTTPTNTICNKNNTLRRQWERSETSHFTYSVHCNSGRIEVASGRHVFTTAVAWAQHICGSRAGEQP